MMRFAVGNRVMKDNGWKRGEVIAANYNRELCCVRWYANSTFDANSTFSWERASDLQLEPR